MSVENRLTQAEFACVKCSYENHADIVGAMNILERGHRLLACGELVREDLSVKLRLLVSKFMMTKLHAEKSFQVEISGPATVDTTIIFVPGFGGARNERGLFTDIEDQVADSMLLFRGDFSDIQGDLIKGLPFSSQVVRLKAITAFAQNKFS
ncbi:MAG: hypothetical protein A3F67_11445 [Verrucomicrobia bacterium RIFCSPHIGHO2_12_FULL_41_10]|nr:MAG: hypothetical protein A3F67_11445 [Verrucomicrobia bacterium RIFCSPHIGHO2_12_FULL_41_10]